MFFFVAFSVIATIVNPLGDGSFLLCFDWCRIKGRSVHLNGSPLLNPSQMIGSLNEGKE